MEEKLIKLADDLDNLGYHKLSDYIDRAIIKLSENEDTSIIIEEKKEFNNEELMVIDAFLFMLEPELLKEFGEEVVIKLDELITKLLEEKRAED